MHDQHTLYQIVRLPQTGIIDFYTRNGHEQIFALYQTVGNETFSQEGAKN